MSAGVFVWEQIKIYERRAAMIQKPDGSATPAASQAVFDYQPTAEEGELIRLSREWMDAALQRRDERRLRELMSQDFKLQIWDASRAPQPLEAWLALLK